MLAIDRLLTRMEGLLLFTGLIAYTVFAIRTGRKESAAVTAEYQNEYGEARSATLRDTLVNLSLMAGGLLLLILGANWLVESATTLARALGLNEFIIGLTVIAVGTSLPELATSLIATLRGQRDIAVGNVIGSNIFNILCVLGLTAMAAPAGMNITSAALNFDLPVMVFVNIACLPIFFNDNRIAR